MTKEMSRESKIKTCAMVGLVLLCIHREQDTTGAVPLTQADELYKYLLKDYNKKLRPVQNQSHSVDVGVSVALSSMNKFDELSGELDLSLVFEFIWREERMFWNESDYGGLQSLYMCSDDVWRPQLFVRESYDTLSDIGNVSGMLKLSADGGVEWHVGNIVKVTCPVDVTYFPFDKQTCLITLSATPFTAKELYLFEISSRVDTSYMTNNSQWTYIQGVVKHQPVRHERSALMIILIFKRRSEFYIVYIIIPLVFLGAINKLVFFMPPNTGERTSVAVTAFLAFVVYMQIVNSSVPQSSMPLAYIYYYLMFLLLNSSLIIVNCIVSIYFYEKKGRVSCFLKYLVIIMKCKCFRCGCSRNNNGVSSMNQNDDDDKKGITPRVHCCKADITWTDVGKTYDTYVFIMHFLVYWTFSGSVFYSLYQNSGFIEPFELDYSLKIPSSS